MGQPTTLTRSQKAAAILVAMGKPAAGRLLKFFKQEELRTLIEAARMLKSVPQNELERIVAEFEAEFAEGAGLMDSAATMDTIFSETLSAEEMSAIMSDRTEKPKDAPPPIWPVLDKLDPARLGAYFEAEHPQATAFALSNLAPFAAAQILLTMSRQARGEAMKRMMALGPAAPAAVQMIEDQLRADLLENTAAKASSGAQLRVASLLNELDKSQLDEVMSDLAAAGATGLDTIRAQLFSFEDIVLLTPKARVALFDGLSSDLVTLALRNADAPLVEAILSALGARARRMIEAELKLDPGNLSQPDIMKARKSIASAAIRLASQGAIELPTIQDAA
jgi:flagellar motor switch protein FliG